MKSPFLLTDRVPILTSTLLVQGRKSSASLRSRKESVQILGNISLVIVGLAFGIYIETKSGKHYRVNHELGAAQYLDINVSITLVDIWTKRSSSGWPNNQMYEGWSKD